MAVVPLHPTHTHLYPPLTPALFPLAQISGSTTCCTPSPSHSATPSSSTSTKDSTGSPHTAWSRAPKSSLHTGSSFPRSFTRNLPSPLLSAHPTRKEDSYSACWTHSKRWSSWVCRSHRQDNSWWTFHCCTQMSTHSSDPRRSPALECRASWRSGRG